MTPSINALRSFEATARLGSVTKAAAELCVTPSAVSHQIRKLEEAVGHPLITFSNAGADLTEWGALLQPGLADGFLRIRDAVSLLSDRENVTTLTLALRSFFGAKWLAPRLPRFWEANPNIALRLHYLLETDDYRSSTADMMIEWHTKAPRGVDSICLMPGFLTPVCSPRLLEAGVEPGNPVSLTQQVLLHEKQGDVWQDWLSIADIPHVVPRKAMFLDDGVMRLQACIAGKGVDISVPDFLSTELATGQLVTPFPDIRLEGYYFAILPDPSAKKLRSFRKWLADELAQP
jgi:LysR family glycine cleavage system transcriptional activator